MSWDPPTTGEVIEQELRPALDRLDTIIALLERIAAKIEKLERVDS